MIIKANKEKVLTVISSEKDRYLFQAVKTAMSQNDIMFLSCLADTYIEDVTGIKYPQRIYKYNSIIVRGELICIYSSSKNISAPKIEEDITRMLKEKNGWISRKFDGELEGRIYQYMENLISSIEEAENDEEYDNDNSEEEFEEYYEEEENYEDYEDGDEIASEDKPFLYFSKLIGTLLQFTNLTGNIYKVRDGYIVETESDLTEFLPFTFLDYKKELVAKVENGEWKPVAQTTIS